jgi:glycosyltransferase involved in cell wall biosynthesis
MKLGVELEQIIGSENGGVVPFLQGVFGSLFEDGQGHELVLFCTAANRALFGPAPAHVRVLEFPRRGYLPLVDAYAADLGLDVLFRTYPSADELAFPEARQVVLIPDLQHEAHPEFFEPEVLRRRRAAFAVAMRTPGGVATLSGHASQSIREHPDCLCPDVFVVSPAVPARPRGAEEDLTPDERAALPQGPFFLYPANMWPHKNHRRTLQAFDRFLRDTGLGVEFVFTGHPDGWAEVAAEFPGRPVRHLGYVRRGFLDVLMARAEALVFFSLFEGFGIPLLEAFRAGTPVLCSDRTSLPEVGGDAVLACDPTDPSLMAAALGRIVRDRGLRDRLAARGRERFSLYDWRSSAAALVAGCARVAAQSRSAVPPISGPVRELHRILTESEAESHRTDRELAARLRVIHDLDAAVHEQVDLLEMQRRTIADLNAAREAQEEAIRRLQGDVQRLSQLLAERFTARLCRVAAKWLRPARPDPASRA